ncbi:MAG TPA: methyl-accepting chemotaxis protein, partial [Nocardioides sp.]|nr:methyl-accepting chemotaxis protein [Nocardioides sp.]
MLKSFVRRVDNLRIGVRLGAVFALCGLLIAAAFALDLKAQKDASRVEDQVEQVEIGQDYSSRLLIAINEISGWQSLYINDAAAYGIEKGMAEDAYNIQGYADSQAGIVEFFDTMDTSMLTSEERAILGEIEGSFEQFFAEDLKLRKMLTTRGLEALPAVMDSINGGPAGEAWSATYDATARYQELLDARVAKVEDAQAADLATG